MNLLSAQGGEDDAFSIHVQVFIHRSAEKTIIIIIILNIFISLFDRRASWLQEHLDLSEASKR